MRNWLVQLDFKSNFLMKNKQVYYERIRIRIEDLKTTF